MKIRRKSIGGRKITPPQTAPVRAEFFSGFFLANRLYTISGPPRCVADHVACPLHVLRHPGEIHMYSPSGLLQALLHRMQTASPFYLSSTFNLNYSALVRHFVFPSPAAYSQLKTKLVKARHPPRENPRKRPHRQWAQSNGLRSKRGWRKRARATHPTPATQTHISTKAACFFENT